MEDGIPSERGGVADTSTPRTVTRPLRPSAPPPSRLLHTPPESGVEAIPHADTPPAHTLDVEVPTAVTGLGGAIPNGPPTAGPPRLDGLMGCIPDLALVRDEEGAVSPSPIASWSTPHAVPHRLLVILRAEMAVATAALGADVPRRGELATAVP